MNKIVRTLVVLLSAIFAAGCANQNIKPVEVICPILGVVAGVAIAAGPFEGNDNAGAMAGGAAIGAAIGWLVCKEDEPPPPPPAPAPKPAPKPQPPKDSDGDGVIDPRDECPGTPAGVDVDAVGCPEVGETIVSLQGINFDTDKAVIKHEYEGVLNEAAEVLSNNLGVHHVRVEGHTDSRGSDAHNLRLSQRRAESVVAYLVARGIDADRLAAVGYGESAPVAPNDTPENMYKNRRVDMVVTK
jgi:OmpA-OmpF porin, OOP family